MILGGGWRRSSKKVTKLNTEKSPQGARLAGGGDPMRFLDSEWGEKKYNLPREMAVTVVHSTQAQATVTASHELVSQALSSHPRALAARRATPRREFSAASRGPSPGPQPVPDFFPCSLAPAAADTPWRAEPMAFGAGDEVVGAAVGAAAVGEKPVPLLSSTRAVQSCCASRGALLASISANVIRTRLGCVSAAAAGLARGSKAFAAGTSSGG